MAHLPGAGSIPAHSPMEKQYNLTDSLCESAMDFYARSAHDPNSLQLLGNSRRGRRAAKALARRGVVAIDDGNATAAGMSRLLAGTNVKDTVKK